MFATTYKDSLKEKSYSSDLTWEDWFRVKALIQISTTGRPIKLPLKDIVDAIFYINKNGCLWENLPHDFPHYKRVHEWFTKWRDDGTWQRILDHLREEVRETAGRDPHPSHGSLDSQTCKTAATAGERGYDGGKKINGRKRHIICCSMGLPIAILVTAANVSDAVGAEILLKELTIFNQPRLEKIHVDSAYNRKTLQDYLTERQTPYELVFRKRPKGVKGFFPLKHRWKSERFFGWLGLYRRLAKDYESNMKSSEAQIKITAISILLKRRSIKTNNCSQAEIAKNNTKLVA